MFKLSVSTARVPVSQGCQRVAHRCPQCGRCFIYRSQVSSSPCTTFSPIQSESLQTCTGLQVIRHLRSNRSCGLASTHSPVNPKIQAGGEPHPPDPRPVKDPTCFQCSTVFQSKDELLSHQRSHRARPVYQCVQCDRAFHHLSSLTNHNHTQMHLDREGFACSRCNKTFQSAKERDAHRLQDRPPKLSCFVCSVCSQTFSSQTLLLRHLSTHSTEGEGAQLRYSCRFCEHTFSGETCWDTANWHMGGLISGAHTLPHAVTCTAMAGGGGVPRSLMLSVSWVTEGVCKNKCLTITGSQVTWLFQM